MMIRIWYPLGVTLHEYTSGGGGGGGGGGVGGGGLEVCTCNCTTDRAGHCWW